jgi:3-phenylpropionate/trans-cinnamate dioxygenase ferredoxin subunit
MGHMSNLVELGTIGELEDGAMKEVLVQGYEIVVARVGDNYYAADNRCPHMGGNLSRGRLEGTVVTCPRHGSQFDLRDGLVVRWLKGSGVVSMIGKALKSPSPLTVYDVKVENDRVITQI